MLCLSAGIGTLLGVWLGDHPGTHPLLIGRTGYLRSTVPELLLSDSLMTALHCDASLAEDATAGLICMPNAELAAVIHAGGILQDSALLRQTSISVRAVLAPKLRFMVHGSVCVQQQPLQAVNLFSSVSAFLGSPGQANYAAANSAINAWATLLQQQGVAGLYHVTQLCFLASV